VEVFFVGYTLKCADVGVPSCSWQGSGNTMEELMTKAAQHAKEAHGMTSIPPDMAAKVKAAVKQS